MQPCFTLLHIYTNVFDGNIVNYVKSIAFVFCLNLQIFKVERGHGLLFFALFDIKERIASTPAILYRHPFHLGYGLIRAPL